MIDLDSIRHFMMGNRETTVFCETEYLSRWCQTETGHLCPNKGALCCFILKEVYGFKETCHHFSLRRWSCTVVLCHQNHSGFKSVIPVSQTHRNFNLFFSTVGETIKMVSSKKRSSLQQLWICVYLLIYIQFIPDSKLILLLNYWSKKFFNSICQ